MRELKKRGAEREREDPVGCEDGKIFTASPARGSESRG